MSTDPVNDANERRVPEDLMSRMHDANEQLHTARQELEKSLDDAEYDHLKRVDRAQNELRKAEEGVEKVSEEISDSIKHPSEPA